MKERGILFNSEMVRAILEGKKTQTRRVVKNQKRYWKSVIPHKADKIGFQCPFGKAGDRLWVRETWASETKDMKYAQAQHEDGMSESPIRYRVTDDVSGLNLKWKPSIYMPRWASRINLEILTIRVERVQEISEEDAKAEGFEHQIKNPTEYQKKIIENGGYQHRSARNGFRLLWDWIHCRKGFGWDANPFVWVIESLKIEGIKND